MKRLVQLLAMVCVLFPGTNLAADLGLGLRIGTQGLGAEGAVGLNKWITLRGGYYSGSISEDFEEGGIDYNGELEVGGLGALADFFPMRGKFRITGGMFSNNNEIKFDTTPTMPIEIGDDIYNPSDIGRLDGKVEFDSSAPYLGIGWGNTAQGQGRVGFVFDLGALFEGSGDVSLTRSSTVPIPGLDQNLQMEIAEIEDDIDDYDIWPVISAGVAIRF